MKVGNRVKKIELKNVSHSNGLNKIQGGRVVLSFLICLQVIFSLSLL